MDRALRVVREGRRRPAAWRGYLGGVGAAGLACVTALVACSVACSSSSGGGPAAPPGDMFFKSVYATSGGGGEVDVVLHSPSAVGAASGVNWQGGAPAGQSVQAVLYPASGVPVVMNGTWNGSQDSASYTAQSSDGSTTISGTVGSNGGSTTGTLMGSGGSGTFGGQNTRVGQVQTFCGTYSGSASGNWNFVVSAAGSLSGAFSGAASGDLTGSASGTSANLQWSDPSLSVSGSATGTIDSSGVVTGQWSGSGYSGTWQSSSGGCMGVPAPATPSNTSPCGNLPCAGNAVQVSNTNVVSGGGCSTSISVCCAFCVGTG
jgi:hypothetical protein